jgi:hypothetical protein
VLVCGSTVTAHATGGEGALLATLPHARRVLATAQATDDVLLTGAEDGSLRLWDLRAGAAPQQTVERAHATRIKGLAALAGPGAGGAPASFASAATDGVVRVWDARMLSSGSACRPVGQAETRARITCLCAAEPGGVAGNAAKPAPKPKAPKADADPAAAAALEERRAAAAQASGSKPQAPPAAAQQQKGAKRGREEAAAKEAPAPAPAPAPAAQQQTKKQPRPQPEQPAPSAKKAKPPQQPAGTPGKASPAAPHGGSAGKPQGGGSGGKAAAGRGGGGGDRGGGEQGRGAGSKKARGGM